MLKSVIIVLSLACGFGAAIPVGLVPRLDERIIGGTSTSIRFFPYQAALEMRGFMFCGGSVLTRNTIITAAHCLEGINAKKITVRAGSSRSEEGGVLFDVAAYKIHEGYKPSTSENDVAVLRLKSPLDFGPTIKNIRLSESAPPNGAAAVISGWGVTHPNNENIPKILKYANVEIIREEFCGSASFDYGDLIKPPMICAAAEGKDACIGDSGGPLVSDDVLVGIVSWGISCAESNHPGVYSSVPILRKWIIKAAGEV